MLLTELLKSSKGGEKMTNTVAVGQQKVPVAALEQTAETFYAKLSAAEVAVVRGTLDDLGGYMNHLGQKEFLIAGVGGILRHQHPDFARDIDVAVVGLTYPDLSGFEKVKAFTENVYGYFIHVIDEWRKAGREAKLGRGSNFSPGSGPFSHLDTEAVLIGGESPIEMATRFDDFGRYNSKGLQVRHDGSRPVDIQFVYDRAPQDWKLDQTRPGELFLRYEEERDEAVRKGTANKLLYAVLAESKAGK